MRAAYKRGEVKYLQRLQRTCTSKTDMSLISNHMEAIFSGWWAILPSSLISFLLKLCERMLPF